jgi:peptidoglycan hydrolase-like protein with peptidoglycan-binding domain
MARGTHSQRLMFTPAVRRTAVGRGALPRSAQLPRGAHARARECGRRSRRASRRRCGCAAASAGIGLASRRDRLRSSSMFDRKEWQMATEHVVVGRFTEPSKAGDDDGRFGPATQNAILGFQKWERLDRTALLNTATKARLAVATHPGAGPAADGPQDRPGVTRRTASATETRPHGGSSAAPRSGRCPVQRRPATPSARRHLPIRQRIQTRQRLQHRPLIGAEIDPIRTASGHLNPTPEGQDATDARPRAGRLIRAITYENDH